MELLFLGAYTDTVSLTSERTSYTTFQNMSEIIKEGDLERPNELILQLTKRPVMYLKLFCAAMEHAVYEKNLIVLTLNPKDVYKHIPKYMIKHKNGEVTQKKMITWIPRWLEELSDANTIVFIHYSLYDPYDANKKYIYITLVKENQGLETVLKANGFKQNRNR